LGDDDTDAEPSNVVAGYESGFADPPELDARIKEAWAQVLADPVEREKVAELLEVPVGDLDPEKVPFAASQGDAGLAGGEILILVASTFFLAFLQGAGKDLGMAASRKLQKLWSDYMIERVNPPGSGNLGEPKQ